MLFGGQFVFAFTYNLISNMTKKQTNKAILGLEIMYHLLKNLIRYKPSCGRGTSQPGSWASTTTESWNQLEASTTIINSGLNFSIFAIFTIVIIFLSGDTYVGFIIRWLGISWGKCSSYVGIWPGQIYDQLIRPAMKIPNTQYTPYA